MRNALLLMAIPALALAVPAAAQSASSEGTVDITGSVASRCLFTTSSDIIPLGELALAGSDTAAGKLNSAVVDNQTRTLVGWCNDAASTITVEATELTTSAAAASGFANRIDFTATADANSASAEDSTLVAGAGTPVSVGMFTGDVVVTLSDSETVGDLLLVAGDYTGSVKVTLAPSVVL